MLGGFMADGMQRKQLDNLPADIVEGVRFHWRVDEFTDAHPIFKESAELFRPTQNKYATVVLDIVFDHFLAANWKTYSDSELDTFADSFYRLAHEQEHLLTDRHRRLLFYMERDNWLYNYRTLDGLQQALFGISRKASLTNNMHRAIAVVETHYETLSRNFSVFYPELMNIQ